MKVLQKFSIKGLKRFQNILFVFGFLLLPLFFFADLLIIKIFLALSCISIFWGFRMAEKMISRKLLQMRNRRKAVKDRDTLEQVNIHLMEHLEELFIQKGYSISRSNNPILDSLYQEFSSCSTVREYRSLKEKIESRIAFVSSMSTNNKQEKKNKNQEQKKHSRTKESHDSFNTSSKPLQVLHLPEGTKDMVIIKQAYKKLIKQYHPDINASSEAGEKTVQLNLAFEQIKKDMEAS